MSTTMAVIGELGSEDLLDPLGDIATSAASRSRRAEPTPGRRPVEVSLENLATVIGRHAPTGRLVMQPGIGVVRNSHGGALRGCLRTVRRVQHSLNTHYSERCAYLDRFPSDPR